MTKWFCQPHRLAGLARDPVCCDRALLVACESDASVWYRTRIGMRTVEERNAIFEWRQDINRMHDSLLQHALRHGRGWTMTRVEGASNGTW